MLTFITTQAWSRIDSEATPVSSTGAYRTRRVPNGERRRVAAPLTSPPIHRRVEAQADPVRWRTAGCS